MSTMTIASTASPALSQCSDDSRIIINSQESNIESDRLALQNEYDRHFDNNDISNDLIPSPLRSKDSLNVTKGANDFIATEHNFPGKKLCSDSSTMILDSNCSVPIVSVGDIEKVNIVGSIFSDNSEGKECSIQPNSTTSDSKREKVSCVDFDAETKVVTIESSEKSENVSLTSTADISALLIRQDSFIPLPQSLNHEVSKNNESSEMVSNKIVRFNKLPVTDATQQFAETVQKSEGKKLRTQAKMSTPQQPESKRRRSERNTNRLAFSNRNSLQYRRLYDLFFCESIQKCSRTMNNLDYFVINNLKLFPVCSAPNIYTIPNFLTASELQHLQNKIKKGRFRRSFVDQGDIQSEVKSVGDAATATKTSNARVNSIVFDDQHRISTFLSFQKQEDKKIQSIEQRAAELLGYWSSTTAVEPLQLVRYLPGQFFGVHHDLGDYDPMTGTVLLPPKTCLSQRRLVTIFVYLNECKNGGATHFPAAARQLRVHPTSPGTAVLFCNILQNGQPDPRTIHEGEKVGDGCVKYGLNIWLCEA